MSFFGFDTTLPKEALFPKDGAHDEEGIDFEETYDDLADRLVEEGDDLNDETFGVSAGNIGRDFDFFNQTAQASSKLEDEQEDDYKSPMDKIISETTQASSLPQVNPVAASGERNVEETVDTSVNTNMLSDLRPMASIWDNIVPEKPIVQPAPPEVSGFQNRLGAQTNEKVFSLQELEEQLFNSLNAPGPKPQQPVASAMPAVTPVAPQTVQVPPPSTLTHDTFAALDPAVASIGNVSFPIQQSNVANPGLPLPPMMQPSQLFANPNVPPPQVPPVPYPTNMVYGAESVPPVPLLNLFQQEEFAQARSLDEKRQKLERDHMLMAQCAGLMTRSDKSFIARIQISQLMSEDPESDDFYYRVYSIIRGRNPSEEDSSHFIQTYLGPSSNRRRGRRSENPMQRLQQQLQKLVYSAKERPKTTQLSLEGALGKIAINTVRTPRQLLNVKRPSEQTINAKETTFKGFATKKDVLQAIERIYDWLLDFEQSLRKLSVSNIEDEETFNEWKSNLNLKLESIWNVLHINESLDDASKARPPFLSVISHPKGMRLLPRLLPHLSKDQQFAILTVIVCNVDSLNIVLKGTFDVNGELPAGIATEMNAFTQFVIPSLLTIVNELGMSNVNTLFSQLLGRSNALYLIQTKIGLSFLTMLISRAEILKQTGSCTEEDKENWEMIFNGLFDRLKDHFATVFPPPNARAYADESYPWEFLAACATAASSDQHFVLVSETRDRVLDNIITSKRAPEEIAVVRIANVNLFLNAMGLDARQLSA
ncbi:topoisomerase II-associated deadenylation- dependent mRNA-decapping factor [Schizosaccharomyces cryophilus OY26]|uniref:Topoisomerase II-associated deadenylation-dependent mRNA-decapping factor n=1 Tax=Schizosaccharomyces cryophilus (strain OY26 / ATCC MYA-4695 / CBS 11777 / NBRC 106824 / NRRL Y48691) TaxID=653667 RepID=S9XGU2_SCHCR|nr:topoisomerase II-associated deadenylation- dependent mRNA-decapping factor [Schizosaccharomyces cryophilus OY26]EPY52871.1 topoisomerase II-associated deadenylation- dependent mRNA-decapping factor [Schizosaccharomyces cryophilus OY26]